MKRHLLSLLVTAVAFFASEAAAQNLTVNPVNREESRTFFNTVFMASGPAPADNWTGSIATCTAGTVSQAFLDATVLRINFYRAMAGDPANVTFSDTYNASAQAAALMMSANKDLNHTPPMTWTCYTTQGNQGAGASNLSLGSYGPRAVDGQMGDGGANNRDAGHRRWLIYPQQTVMGSGNVPPTAAGGFPAANAVYVSGDRAPQRPPTRDEFVSWPPRGFVPYQITFPRWSFSFAAADFTNSTVTMTRNGAAVPINIQSRNGNFGERTLVWIPNNMPDSGTWPKPAADETYTVAVNNVVINGMPRNFTYDVTIFDPTVPGADYMPAVVTGPDMPPLNQNSTYNFTTVPNATGYQWRSTKLTALTLTDGAENGLANFDAMVSNYNPVDTMFKATGNAGFRLTLSAGFGPQTLTLKRNLLATATSQISFKSRFENIVGAGARVEVSTDGGNTWAQPFNQVGTDAQEGVFTDKVVSLAAFAGRQIKVRFSLAYVGGAVFTCCDPIGWYFDDITFTNLYETAAPTVTNVTAGTSFNFSPTEQAEFNLDVRPQFFGQYFGEYGPAKRVSTLGAPAPGPAITTQPLAQTVTVGDQVMFNVVATGTAPLTYQWKLNGANLTDTGSIQGSTTATLTLQNIQPEQAGDYTVVVTNNSGNVTSNPATLTVNPPVDLGQAVDLPPQRMVATGGAAGWTPRVAPQGGAASRAQKRSNRSVSVSAQTVFTHDGQDSARSGAIGPNQQSYLQVGANGPAFLSFWWRVDSEPDYDLLSFEVDGQVIDSISGFTDWEQVSYEMPAGQHTFRWIYSKDATVSQGADAGWVDQISILQQQPPPSLGQALDNLNLRWATTGDLAWYSQSDVTHDGNSAARSGPIGDSQESRLETDVVGPGQLSFWWRVDCEGGFDEELDTLSFELDGVTPFSPISGNLDWEQKSISIPAGTHHVAWTYSKDGFGSAGLDSGFVDQVTFTPQIPASGPPLLFEAVGQKLRLSWISAAADAGFKLQYSTSLSSWQDVPADQIYLGEGEFFVLVDKVGHRFYRLLKP